MLGKTHQSKLNENRIQECIQNFDYKLRLRFNQRNNCYYITRPSEKGFNFSDVPESDPVWYSTSPYGEAFRRGEVVIINQIDIWLMERLDDCKRNVLRFLKENFIPAKAATKEGRIAVMEQEYDEMEKKMAAGKRYWRDEAQNFSRDYWRTHIQPHAYFSGVANG